MKMSLLILVSICGNGRLKDYAKEVDGKPWIEYSDYTEV